jgi:hypothetical protein
MAKRLLVVDDEAKLNAHQQHPLQERLEQPRRDSASRLRAWRVRLTKRDNACAALPLYLITLR